MKKQCVFIPGDDWVYFKIYTGIRTADMMLVDKLFPVIKKMIKNNYICKFYFIRYYDSDFHIRLRLFLSNSEYFNIVVNVINSILKPMLNKQLIWKIQLDTYYREIERYNLYLVEDTESLFYYDSIYILLIIRQLERIRNENCRWMISLLLIDRLLSDLGFTLEKKNTIMILISNSYKKEFGFNKFNSKQFNEKYRANKNFVESVLDNVYIDGDFEKLISLVCKRSEKMKSVISNILQFTNIYRLNIDDYVISYIHMTMNRLFINDNRVYELIIYDFMRRYYTSKIAVDSRNNY